MDESFDLVEKLAPSEQHLQDLIKENPQLIPSDDLGLDGDLLVVGRETTLASGAIDLLCLARSGDLVLVEFKTGPQNPDFRHTLAQVIDYGSHLWQRSVEEFDRGVVQRYLAGNHVVAEYSSANDLAGAIGLTHWNLSDEERSALDVRLAEVLKTGDFTYVIAAQRFTPTMRTSLDYLNATMRYGRFFLVEVVQLQGKDLTAHAAQVVAAAPKQSGTSGPTVTSLTNQTDFLAGISSPTYRDAIKDLIATCSTLGLLVNWQFKGASLRIYTPDRNEPLSIGWLFLPGDQWNGATHLTFGVGLSSLEQTPTIQSAVREYVERIKSIPGATPVKSKLDAYTFMPEVVAAAKDAIVSALEALVEDAQQISGPT